MQLNYSEQLELARKAVSQSTGFTRLDDKPEWTFSAAKLRELLERTAIITLQLAGCTQRADAIDAEELKRNVAEIKRKQTAINARLKVK